MMKLRWLIKKYPQPTKEEMEHFLQRSEGIVSKWEMEKYIREGFEKLNEKVLQVWIPYDCENIQGSNCWQDVPIVVEEANG